MFTNPVKIHKFYKSIHEPNKKLNAPKPFFKVYLEMPNKTGGKKYKSGKHQEVKAELYEIDWANGQSIGRVLKHLGDRNVLLFCNDGKERIGHIRGGLRKKKAFIGIGDIVLYSNRTEGIGSATTASGKERGDILEKFNHEIHNKLKKVDKVNPNLFNQLESVETSARAQNSDEGGFEFDDTESEADDDDKDTSEEEKERDAKKQKEEQRRTEARNAKSTTVESEDVIDIDAI